MGFGVKLNYSGIDYKVTIAINNEHCFAHFEGDTAQPATG